MKIFRHNKPDVVILCGGKGTRLRTVVSDRPKPMAEVSGMPFLDRLIKYYASFGLDRFILCTGYKGGFIKTHYASGKTGLKILISREKRPLGTAGAVKHAQSKLKSNNFIVLNGDSYSPVDIRGLFDLHRKKKALATIALTIKKSNRDCGFILMRKDQKIVCFSEKCGIKNKNARINLGVYLFNKEVLKLIPIGRKVSLENDLFPSLVDKKFFGFSRRIAWLDIGTPARYKTAENFFKKKA